MMPMVTFLPSPATWTTMMHVFCVSGAVSRPNFTRRSTTGMTFPRRLMTPRK